MDRNMVTAFLSTAGVRLAILVSSLFLTPIFINVIGFELYGRYGTLMAIFGLVTIFMSSGINSGSRKYLGEDRDVTSWRDHVFGYYFRLGTVLAVLTSLGFVAAIHFGLVARFFGPAYEIGFYGLAALTLATQFREYSRRSLMGLKLEHRSEPLRLLQRVGMRVVLILIGAVGYGIGGMMIGLVGINLLTGVLAIWFLKNHLSLRTVLRRTPDDFPSRELFDFNHLSIVYYFLLTSMYHVDVLMLASTAIVSETQVGYYKSALVLSQFLWFVPRSVQSIMMQSTSNLWAEERYEQITQIASRVTRYALLVVLLLAIGVGALATEFVPIYLGEGSMPVVAPLLILLPGTVAFATARPIFAISHAKGDTKPLIAATGVSALLNLGLNVALIPRYGLLGAAAATTVGYASLPVTHTITARYLGYRPFADARLLRIGATAVIAGVPIVLLSSTIQNEYLALVVVPVVGLVAYATMAFVTGAVDVAETLDVLSSLPDPIGSRAAALDRRRRSNTLGRSTGGHTQSKNGGFIDRWLGPKQNLLQRAFLVLGVLLALSGVALAMGVPGVPDVDVTPDPGIPNATPTSPTGVTETASSPTSTPETEPTNSTATTVPTATTPPPDTTESPRSETTSTGTATSTGTVTTERSTVTSEESDPDPGPGTETETSTPTPTQTETVTPTPTSTQTETATSTPTSTQTETATSTPTSTQTETVTSTPTSTQTETATSTPTSTQTETATSTPTSTQTENETSTSTQTETATPTSTSTQTETDESLLGPLDPMVQVLGFQSALVGGSAVVLSQTRE